MSVKLLKKSKDSVDLLFSGYTPDLINSLRSSLISDVPVMAISKVFFEKNDSALYNEIISHRLGLVPLSTDYSYSFVKNCKCKGEGCSRCQVSLTLNKTGPCVVYSDDLKSSDSNVKPVIGKIPIVTLLEGQALSFEAIAELGTGRAHAKWGSGLAYYKLSPVIKIDNKNVSKESKLIVEACPRNVLEFKADKLVIKDLAACNMCKACEAAATNNEIKILSNPEEIVFHYEAWGQLPIIDALGKALDVNVEELKEFKSQLK